MPESDIILIAEDISKRFGEKQAVDRLSLEVRRGEVLGLLGVNGAGKSTTMNMLLGLTIPDSGRIEAFGMDLKKHRIEILKRSNFSSTYADLPANLSVLQNLKVFAKIYGVAHPRERITELLELFEISHLSGRTTGHLSSGESTRLNLCKALLNRPELLMLDEPTASLDPDIADKVRKIVRRVQEEERMAILYTSHNMKDIEEVCDRIIFIHEGRIASEGTADEVKGQFSQDSLEGVFIRIARSGELKEAARVQAP